MSGVSDDRLQRLLGGDRLAILRRRLRRHFERVPPDRACESFRINGLAADEYTALALLTGRPPRFAGSLQIDIRAVDAALRQAGIAESLRAALVKLDGPIINSAVARAERERLWSSVVADCGHPGLARHLQSPAAIGLLKRLSGSDPTAAAGLCCRVEAVLRCLPAKGLTRAQLAADSLGDPHALDGGQAVATLVLAVWRQIDPQSEPETGDTLSLSGDVDCIRQDLRLEKGRDTWARAGVLVNELARPVVVLNLPVGDGERTAHLAGEPGYLSLRRTDALAAIMGGCRTRCLCMRKSKSARYRRGPAGTALPPHGLYRWDACGRAGQAVEPVGTGRRTSAVPWRFRLARLANR